MNPQLPAEIDLSAPAPELSIALSSSILVGLLGLLPLIRSGCGPPS